MKAISLKEYNVKMREIKSQNASKLRWNNLKAEKNKYKKKFRFPSTSKIILVCVLILCFEIVLFSEYAMIKLNDASSIYALIGVPAALAPTIWAYYSKAKAENTSGGITYELAMKEFNEDISYTDTNTETENVNEEAG